MNSRLELAKLRRQLMMESKNLKLIKLKLLGRKELYKIYLRRRVIKA